jgi:hypothetical protein
MGVFGKGFGNVIKSLYFGFWIFDFGFCEKLRAGVPLRNHLNGGNPRTVLLSVEQTFQDRILDFGFWILDLRF